MRMPHEDLPRIRDVKTLLEEALKKADEITPRASTGLMPPNPNRKLPAAINIQIALNQVNDEIKALERITKPNN
jgi:hypothetical protein